MPVFQSTGVALDRAILDAISWAIIRPMVLTQARGIPFERQTMMRDHTKFMCDVNELSGLFSDSKSLQVFLGRIAAMVVEHMHSQVCSLYLYKEETRELVLKATQGLNPVAVDTVRLKLGEGLTGLALKEMRPICEANASRSPHYRYFPDIGEEPYESFLAVPILRGHTRIGVLVIQNLQKSFFKEEDIRAFQVVASQLANTLETAQVLMGLHEPAVLPAPAEGPVLKFVKGKPAVEGWAMAPLVVFDRRRSLEDFLTIPLARTYTLADFFSAVQATEVQLKQAQANIEDKLADAASLIFTAQILMLKDDEFISAVTEKIQQGLTPREAVVRTVALFAERFDALPNEYLREKKQDVLDIGLRLLDQLVGFDKEGSHYRDKIVVARELFPSDLLRLASENVKGIILLSGGVTSHLTILTRSLGVPLVIAEEPRLFGLPAETVILLDGEMGNIYVSPTTEVLKPFQEREEARARAAELRAKVKDHSVTRDGTRVKLLANINLLSDLKTAREYKAEGVGLYRTEFPFIIRSNFPTEEEQYFIYRKLVEGMTGKEITFRTLDIGGDKVLSYYDFEKEENPFLGMRSIRFSLRHQDIFRQQLRAILRAGVGENLKIMFPMISSLDEFLESKQALEECQEELSRQGIPCHRSPAVGMMVELPAVVELAEDFAQVADFFSIGTNDFIQYMLAVDRTNEKVADLYLPYHPAILRSLKRVVAAAQRYGKEVSICGQMAQEEKYLPYFLGIGLRTFSLDVGFIPRVQEAIAAIELSQAQMQTDEIIACKKVRELKDLIQGKEGS